MAKYIINPLRLSRNITNPIRYFMDEWLPPIVRDSKFFMYPFFYIWFKRHHIRRYMEFKSLVYSMTKDEYETVYRELDCIAKDRESDLNTKCRDYILSKLAPEAKTLLDVGCGSASFLKLAQRKGYAISGCDVLDEVRINGGEYRKGNIENLPFEDGEFDIVTSIHTLEHVRDIHRAIAELKRVAKRQLVIVVPCQRYCYYSLDLHIHFFPVKEQLQYLIGLPNSSCVKLWGDWVYIGQL